ncbi:NhaP-type Na+/H+ or K+/H+ antiporter [Streptomyces rapamycinicus]|uniref:NhaP-type Na+/H+ or K+/H+ antiporter n=1 Tax=Streptomyces rapamycinicus TaxID=1226757 RepID=A0ABR6LEK7_9ACTN|nr:NhaP-type Na+/H+ or K+/H+ antiporter [Streptomyces rapamycinicus]
MAVAPAIVVVRPASLLISLIGTRFARREKPAAAWFGPKGFASVVYGPLVLEFGIPRSEEAYTVIAVCIAFSIAAHSSTDVPVARLFDVEDLAGIPDDDDENGHHVGREKQTAGVARAAPRVEEDGDART